MVREVLCWLGGAIVYLFGAFVLDILFAAFFQMKVGVFLHCLGLRLIKPPSEGVRLKIGKLLVAKGWAMLGRTAEAFDDGATAYY